MVERSLGCHAHHARASEGEATLWRISISSITVSRGDTDRIIGRDQVA